MKVTVSKENCTIPNDWIKIGEFEDLWHPVIFIKAVLDDEDGPVNLKINYEPDTKIGYIYKKEEK